MDVKLDLSTKIFLQAFARPAAWLHDFKIGFLRDVTERFLTYNLWLFRINPSLCNAILKLSVKRNQCYVIFLLYWNRLCCIVLIVTIFSVDQAVNLIRVHWDQVNLFCMIVNVIGIRWLLCIDTAAINTLVIDPFGPPHYVSIMIARLLCLTD